MYIYIIEVKQLLLDTMVFAFNKQTYYEHRHAHNNQQSFLMGKINFKRYKIVYKNIPNFGATL